MISEQAAVVRLLLVELASPNGELTLFGHRWPVSQYREHGEINAPFPSQKIIWLFRNARLSILGYSFLYLASMQDLHVRRRYFLKTRPKPSAMIEQSNIYRLRFGPTHTNPYKEYHSKKSPTTMEATRHVCCILTAGENVTRS